MNRNTGLSLVGRDVRLLRLFRTVTKTAQTVRVCAAVGIVCVIAFDVVRMVKNAR